MIKIYELREFNRNYIYNIFNLIENVITCFFLFQMKNPIKTSSSEGKEKITNNQNQNVFNFWKEKQNDFPILSEKAKKYLSIVQVIIPK